MKVLKEISTHKAIKRGNKIAIYKKGMDINTIAPDGKRLFDDEDKIKHPHWFKDEFLYFIDDEDDIFYIFEGLKENNRCLLAEINNQ